MESPARAQAHGPALIRLLARIGGSGAAPSPHALSARLAQWVEWPQAVALSAALDARPAAADDGRPAPGDDGEYARVRAALVRAIEGDRAFATADADAVPPDAAFHRQRYLALQQMMEAEIGHLRGRLRNRLAKHATDVARLAAIDAVIERALGRQERALLAPVPDLVGLHFERLRQAAQEALGATAAPPVAWLHRFHHDMRQLLLAELDFRLQPAQGLQAALRSTVAGSHAP